MWRGANFREFFLNNSLSKGLEATAGVVGACDCSQVEVVQGLDLGSNHILAGVPGKEVERRVSVWSNSGKSKNQQRPSSIRLTGSSNDGHFPAPTELDFLDSLSGLLWTPLIFAFESCSPNSVISDWKILQIHPSSSRRACKHLGEGQECWAIRVPVQAEKQAVTSFPELE
jgi:hypothetical protein